MMKMKLLLASLSNCYCLFTSCCCCYRCRRRWSMLQSSVHQRPITRLVNAKIISSKQVNFDWNVKFEDKRHPRRLSKDAWRQSIG